MFGSRRKTPRVKAKDIALPAAADEHPFSIVKGGYSVSEVAAFVSGMSADMTTLTPQELRRVSFTIERRGYDKAEVFAYLNRVAAEIEAELDAARERARRERILANDPTLALATSPDDIAAGEPDRAEPEAAARPAPAAEPTPVVEPAPEAEPVTELIRPEPPQPSPVETGLAPGAEVIYFAAPDGTDAPQIDPDSIPGREILWLTEDGDEVDFDEPAAETVAEEPQPAASTEVPTAPPTAPVIQSFTPRGDAPTPAPAPETSPPNLAEQPQPQPQPSVADAATQIGDLLRAAHDSATRLRANAEADMKATVEAARVEIDERTRTQHRELDDAKAAAERRHAEIVHNAQLSANETRSAAELDAARIRAAAEAVLNQARVEVEAVKALAQHNMLEIELAREKAIADASEMLGLGKSMLLSVNDLDRDLASRLVHTRGVLGLGRRALESETS